MKKLLFVFLASLVLFSCQKKDENVDLTQDVVFSIQKVDPSGGLKDLDTSTQPPTCPTLNNDGVTLLVPTYAKIVIDDVEYTPLVFELDGMLYTQSIKLPSSETGGITYTVSDFLLFDVNDQLIMATPAYLGAYSEYVTQTVDFTFEVNAFEKAEVAVEVLCYLPENHDYFGFTWFNITEIVLREFCFYGDICLNGAPYTPEYYDGSLYGTGLGIDVPAIMQISVFDALGAEVPNSPFNNESSLGLGAPLCVKYPDKLNVEGEVFTFELRILTGLVDGTFGYVLFDTFTVTDGGELNVSDGGDGILDFVVGTCGYDGHSIVIYGHNIDYLVFKDLWDETNPNGFMFTSDPSAVAIWKWVRTSTGAAANITDPMSVFLTLAGYEELGLLGYNAILNDLTVPNRFWSTSISGLMGGYNVTLDPSFMMMANSIFPAWSSKYYYFGVGAPRSAYGLFGYDCQNTLRSAKMAAENGVIGAGAFLADYTAWYLSEYIAFASATDPQGSNDRIFINAIAAELGIGTFQGTVVWDPAEYGIQSAAYGLMGGSWANPEVVKAYIIENMCTATNSEPLAEAIYALGL